ncbi:MAG: glycosyl transferase family 2 [Marinilabiliales bacterium]|nr:MAG: glycosyl transferase family 2 [Marinilabiliales bacterium]
MISLEQISVSFGGFELFSNISFMINPKDRIGLVGKNGAGKSTLLKIILGIQSATEGHINFPNDINFGYLPQQMKVENTVDLYSETKKAFDEVIQLERDIHMLNQQIADRTDYESESYLKLIENLSHKTERYNLLSGESIEATIEQTLTGLGFQRSDFERQTKEFSGGWRMRIELAKTLLQKPDVLLLDEPTNHLDIESIQWLEEFLSDYPGAVVLISHDRTFLDNVTSRTIEIAVGKIYDYKVSYSKFTELRKERIQQQEAAYRNQQKLIEESEKFIERFRYKATKANQVQSRIKQLDKLERIEIDETENAKIHFKFPPAPRGGAVVVETENLSKNYGDLLVLNGIDFIIERGEKVAFIGKNGEGKTTFSRIIADQLPYTGTFKLGHNIEIGYYAQNQDELLDESKTVFQTLDDIAVGDIRTKLRDILGAFLFSGEDVDKKVKVLSGGERSRLALAKLLLHPYNLLVLDEPTNHLDMTSKDILKKALQNYDGTLILVSHDRYFLNGLVDKIIEFKNHKIKEFTGGIFEFLRKRKLSSLKEIEKKKAEKQKENSRQISDNKEIYEKRKNLDREIRKTESKIKNTEDKINELELTIADLEEKMAGNQSAEIDYDQLSINYEELKQNLAKKMKEWEEHSYELEIIQEQREELN